MKKNNASHEDSDLDKCIECGNACCRYITVKIPAPRTINDYDGLLWQLYHKDVKLFKDYRGWHLLIYNPCAQIKRNGQCAIYEYRPITCREHSVDGCEYKTSIKKTAMVFFDDHISFEKFCKKKFKTWDRRFE